MTDERRGHSPTPPGGDARLDRDIRRLLAVDPSPAFEARVRARVAAEPPPGAWEARRLWMGFGAAAATAALVLVVAVPRLEPPADTSDEPAGAIAGAGGLATPPAGTAARPRADRPVSDALPAPTAEPDTATGPAAAGAPTNGPRDAASPPAPAARPPGPPRFTRVVFSESETAALRRLLARARDRPVIAPAPVEARTLAVGEPRAELAIPLIAIEPRAELAIEPRAELAIEPRAELVIPPIAIEPPLAIEPLNVALLDTGADQ